MGAGSVVADREYVVDVRCPNCGVPGQVKVRIDSRLEQTRDESTLGVKVKATKSHHACGQTALDPSTGELLPLDGAR